MVLSGQGPIRLTAFFFLFLDHLIEHLNGTFAIHKIDPVENVLSLCNHWISHHPDQFHTDGCAVRTITNEIGSFAPSETV